MGNILTRHQLAKIQRADRPLSRMGSKEYFVAADILGSYPRPFYPEAGTMLCMNLTQDNIDGATLYDLSPNEFHGTAIGSPSPQSDSPFRESVLFNGSTDRYSIPHAGILDLGSDFTVEGWIKIEADYTGDPNFFATRDADSPNWTSGVGVYPRLVAQYGMPANSLSLTLGSGAWKWGVWSSDENSFTWGEWQYVAVTVLNAHTSSKTVTFYVNGVQSVNSYYWTQGSEEILRVSTDPDSAYIGGVYHPTEPTYSDKYFDGGIAGVRVTRRGKTAEEIEDYYYGVNGY